MSRCEMGNDLESRLAAAEALAAERGKRIEELLKENDDYECAELVWIDERDKLQDQIQTIHIALCGDGEWVTRILPEPAPNSGDLGDDSVALAELLVQRLSSIKALLESAVCTEGCDKGVVMLSQDGPTHPEKIKCPVCHDDPDVLACKRCGGTGRATIQVYDHEHFSPLGDALIAAWEKCNA